MLKKYKPKLVEEVSHIAKNYSTIGLLNIYKLPSKQFQSIRNKIKDKALIKVLPKNIIKRVLDNINKSELKKYLTGQPALIMSNLNPFEIYKILEKTKSNAPAKVGDIAPKDIIVNAGKTDLSPGPAITTLQKVKLKTKVEGGKIAILEDQLICKKGEVITEDIAAVLNLLKIEPIEIGIDLVAAIENNIIYPKDVLHIDEEKIMEEITKAVGNMINISLEINYPTKESIEIMIIKAYLEMKSLGINAKILEKEMIEDLIAVASSEALALESKIS
jgi:large subunit ribosomal protein L10